MEEDLIPNPVKGYKPKQPVIGVVLDSNAIDPATLATLHTLDKEALIALVERMARQCGLVATMTQEETAQAMLDALAETALKPIVYGVNIKADIQSRISAIDKWLDRVRGRPAQSVDMTVKAAIVHWPLGRTELDTWDIDQGSIS